METTTPKKPKYAFLTLRAILAFLLLGLLLAVLYHFAFGAYREVAEWGEPGNHDTLIYEGDTYTLVGVLGKKGLTEKKYPIDKIVGQVRDDGLPKLTEPVTEAPTEAPAEPLETEEGEETEPETETETEAVTVIPPKGAEFFESQRDHAYILYSVEDKEDYLLVLEPDGQYYLYQRVIEDTAEDTSA